ncbi:unnamed protein product [Pleuronectes platessa]|uniref:Uncharacterized protein n=1 Tax=Pleuronectes platessa TaxID=8262 RepID=A0A9N7VXJ9_PLEPL|nr:unnamed protein product [Pleuronectes platessa]
MSVLSEARPGDSPSITADPLPTPDVYKSTRPITEQRLTSAEVVHGAEEDARRTAGSNASRTKTRIRRGSARSGDETQETSRTKVGGGEGDVCSQQTRRNKVTGNHRVGEA